MSSNEFGVIRNAVGERLDYSYQPGRDGARDTAPPARLPSPSPSMKAVTTIVTLSTLIP